MYVKYVFVLNIGVWCIVLGKEEEDLMKNKIIFVLKNLRLNVERDR